VRTLHNEKVHNLHISYNIMSISKSRHIMWVENAANMEEMRNSYKTSFGESKGKKSHAKH
jgi:hypothetical protein